MIRGTSGYWLLLCAVVLVCPPNNAPAQAEDPDAAVDYLAELIGDGMTYAHHRFRAAAGRDMVLDEEEFRADRTRGDAAHFVRPFDTWKEMGRWDLDDDGRINWLEAARYRLDQAHRVARAFEEQGDGRWQDAERARANAALARGQLPQETTSLSKQQWHACAGHLRQALRNEDHIALQQNFAPCDRNSDGIVTENEAVHTMVEDDRHFSGSRQAKRADALAQFQWWDADGDGRVDRREIRCAFITRAARSEQAFAQRLREVDLDRDGRVSAAERRKEQERLMLARFQDQDTDGDGRLSPEEAIVLTDHEGANAAARNHFRKRDADADGYISRPEALLHYRRGRR